LTESAAKAVRKTVAEALTMSVAQALTTGVAEPMTRSETEASAKSLAKTRVPTPVTIQVRIRADERREILRKTKGIFDFGF
jgi:hypothetical protein